MNRLVFVWALLLALVSSGCNPVKSTAAAERAVTDFHAKLDAADFKGIYDAAHSDFKAAASEKEFTAVLEAVHRKLGKVQSSERTGWNINSYNLKTNISLSYHTKFAEGDATESFNYRIDGDDAKLLRYDINSTALIVK